MDYECFLTSALRTNCIQAATNARVNVLISLRVRSRQVIKVMRTKDKGGKTIGSNKYK
jgi:hypothetical protein